MSHLPSAHYHVVLLTSRHSISGQMELGEQRLSDLLNDKRGSVVFVRAATIARLNEPGKPLGEYPLTMIPKASIVLAFDLDAKATPAGKRFYRYIPKNRYPVFMIVDHMEVHGMAHSSGELDLYSFSPAAEEKFFPITDAVVTFGSSPYRIQQPAVLVNLRHIQLVSQKEQEPSGKKSAKDAADS